MAPVRSNTRSDGPGAIVKKITNEKSVDRLLNFCYTIIVPREREISPREIFLYAVYHRGREILKSF